MKIELYNQKGEKVKDLALSQSFNVKVSDKAVTLYINYLRNSLRDAIANTKDRSDVSGGGKKPWKQKGTGRARHGSSRSPLWVGGGVTFGPTNERNFKIKINKSLKKQAILTIISDVIKNNKAIALDSFEMKEIKTHEAAAVLSNVKAEGKISVILNEEDTNAYMSLRNIAGVKPMLAGKLDIITMMTSSKVIFCEKSIGKLEELYSKK
jgi:large subunit ribosomal protein L4